MSTQDDVAGATFSVQYQALVANVQVASLTAEPAPTGLAAVVVTPNVVAIYRPIPVG